jgi:N utilization substance protein A
VSSINIDEETRKAEVYLKPDQVSLAIGKGGLNIKLASMLTEYTIDVFRELGEEENEDIYLDEFKDEIDEWVIEAIKSIGLETAKAVLETPKEILVERADLEESTVDEVLSILAAEFDQEPNNATGEDAAANEEPEVAPENESVENEEQN